MPEVPGGAAVDVVLGLAFLLFVLSVVSAAVAELIANAHNSRGKMLRQAIGQLLGEEGARAFYDTRAIRVLHGPNGRLPSYIPTSAFAKAAPDADPDEYEDLMDRVTGWYKRKVQWRVLAIALASVIAINADPFAIGSRFVKDEAIKESVSGAVQEKPPGIEETAQRVEALDELDMPFGWGEQMTPQGLDGWLGRALGWLALAVSIPLGASFWFDLLARVSRQRATGARPGQRVDQDDKEGLDGTPAGLPG